MENFLKNMSIEEIFAEVFLLPIGVVNDDLKLADILSWDSLSHMLLITRLEDVYEIEFTGDQIADISSVGDVRKALFAHGVNI